MDSKPRQYSVEEIFHRAAEIDDRCQWDVWHGGYNTVFMHENPNYGVPLDGVRDTQTQGMLGRLHPYFYSIPGSFGQISVMQNIGKEILKDLKAQGINGALLVST